LITAANAIRGAWHASGLNEPRQGFFPARQPLVGHRRVADGDDGMHVFVSRDFQQVLYPQAYRGQGCFYAFYGTTNLRLFAAAIDLLRTAHGLVLMLFLNKISTTRTTAL
jgi:hypothetical protein